MPRRRVERTLKEKKILREKRKKSNKLSKQRLRRLRAKNSKEKKSCLERVHKCRMKKSGLHGNHNGNNNENYLGPMNIKCSFCSAKHFKIEIPSNRTTFNDCCSHGAVITPSFDNFPNVLKSLFNQIHEYSPEFMQNIRIYNSALSFASFNANLINFKGKRPGPYCFKVKGHIYYQINTALHPEPDTNASYGQLFILDPSIANQQRLDYFSDLNVNVLNLLDGIIRKNNSYVGAYTMMKDEIRKLREQSFARNENNAIPEVTMSFISKSGLDAGRYNSQRSNEVAAIFTTTADGDISKNYVTIRDHSTKELKKVSSMDPNVEPWIYPLFHPRGNLGWDKDMKRNGQTKRITRTAYIKNLMAVRDGFNPYLRGGRLFQQWIVDNYIKVERDRIEFCRNNQEKLRANSYQGVIDVMKERAEAVNGITGNMIILPSTFIGSPRNMAQNYQDAMAIVTKYGKPDLFITMTCNPNWREIRENLEFGQQPSDRPDIITKVFSGKVHVLLDLITKKHIFGRVEAYVGVIEFQKRGLPHIHLLITLARNSKITCPEIIDKVISAEIPDPDKHPTLYKIVMQNMIHGPCGDWCLKNGKCSKKFPKAYQEVTVLNEDGYPLYKRRNNGKYHERANNYAVDNQYVVPYSPKLLYEFNCHCNVELVCSIKSVKYLFKYIYKGHDSANIMIQGTATHMQEIVHDEIKEHIEARYVGPVEACWRILSKKLQIKSHSIVRLPIHLPHQQNRTVNPGADEITSDEMLEQRDMLIEYFALNERDENARRYLYSDIPTYYTFVKTKVNNKYIGRWRKRKSCFKIIGRIYSVSPTQIELHHLRLLLLTQRGARTFNELKTVNGILQPSFTEACLILGLIADDHEWNRALHEAEIWMMPYQLRRLFTRILIHCHPLHPEQLWEEFKNALSEDYLLKLNIRTAHDKALKDIKRFLEEEGKKLKDYLTIPLIEEDEMEISNEEYFQDAMNKGIIYYKQLNEEQKKIADTILQCLENNHDHAVKFFYIDGPGGSGKTFIYITLWHLITGQKKIVQMMAFTGIAATLLPEGKTVHKTLGLAVPLYTDSNSTIKPKTKDANKLKETDIFIWDEAPMAPRFALEQMNRLLQDIMGNKKLFGGKIIVLGGDFRQLLPVNVGGTRGETINLSIKYSFLWKFFTIFDLKTNMRTLPGEIEFSKFLLDIGNGTRNDDDNKIQLPDNRVDNTDVDIAEDIYGNVLRNHKYKEAAGCAILAPTNIQVDDINKKVVELLDINTERIYTSIDTTENCNSNDQINSDIVPEYLNTLNPMSLPPHELRLRRFAIIMLIRNLSIHEGLCNGTRLLILDLENNLLRCKILTGDKTGDIIFLHRITLLCEDKYPFSFSRRQFPIRLAFAITINKSQGQTFSTIGIDLRKDVFNHGQLYVALSRVRSWDSLKIYIGTQRQNKLITNEVWKELYN